MATGRRTARAAALPRGRLRLLLPGLALSATLAAPVARCEERAPGAVLPGTGTIENGLFREGQDGIPRSWAQMAYDGRASRFSWSAPGDAPGIATIASDQPNDASWVQRVAVTPGRWYLVSAWMRAVDVGASGAGARLSLLRSFRESEQLRGTTDWRRVSLWVQSGADESAFDVACRLGGNGAVATGTVHCTGVAVEAAVPPDLDAPGVFADPQLDPRTSRGLALGTAALAAGGLLLLAWRLLAPETWRFPP
ncbi:hypothetical protein KGQ64_05500 [bacterium]|nr:hypothetical protein [bacterium]